MTECPASPRLGIFWFAGRLASCFGDRVDRPELLAISKPMAEVPLIGGFRTMDLGHVDAWPALQRTYGFLHGTPYEFFPRGRVNYIDDDSVHLVLLDPRLAKPEFIALIERHFLLPASRRILTDPHYRSRVALGRPTFRAPSPDFPSHWRAVMTTTFRAWAMRTSRNSQAHREYVKSELDRGVLRQGWGLEPDQDLRIIRDTIRCGNVGRGALTGSQLDAWGHRKFLGEDLGTDGEGICRGDIVLVPNTPQEGFFTLCRVTGGYEFAIDARIGDLGHCRPVDVLTPGGVSNTSPLVSEGLRRSLRCHSRLWWIGNCQASIEAILTQVDKDASLLRQGSDHVSRARLAVRTKLRESLDNLAADISGPLSSNLQAAEWEPVLAEALQPLMRDVQVIRTGGPAERGADLEIHIPNPFEPGAPWIIAVQVKNYTGTISADVALQLEEAIRSRQDDGARGGRLVGVVLASTHATPSPELLAKMSALKAEYRVQVSCASGPALMRIVAQGLFMSYRDQPLD